MLHDAALDDGEFLHRALDAEIAAGYHDAVGSLDDVVDDGHGMLVLDLGYGAGLAAMLVEHALEFQDVLGLAAETQGHIIHIKGDAEFDVGEVLFP